MDYDTKLISEVKKYPAIYDNGHRDFKNKEVKQAVWAEISFTLKNGRDEATVRAVRNRWKSLRDSYVKDTKRKMARSIGENVVPRRAWRYCEAMSFMAPFLSISFPSRKSDEREDKEEACPEPMDAYFVASSPYQESSGGHFMGAFLNYQNDTAASDDPDDIHSFFRGVADTVKRLSPANQVKIQKDIVNLVLDVKLKEFLENNNNGNK